MVNGKYFMLKMAKGKKTELFQSLITSMRSYGNTGFPIRTGISCFQPDLLLIEKRQTYLLKRRVLQVVFKKALVESGVIRQATPHTLRHSYATHLLDAGVNIRVIQKYLGHRSLRATIVYIHLTNTTEVRCVELLNKLMGDL